MQKLWPKLRPGTTKTRQAVSISQEAAAPFASQPQALQRKHQGKPCSIAAHLQIPHIQLECVVLGWASAGAGALRWLHLTEDVFLHGQQGTVSA